MKYNFWKTFVIISSLWNNQYWREIHRFKQICDALDYQNCMSTSNESIYKMQDFFKSFSQYHDLKSSIQNTIIETRCLHKMTNNNDTKIQTDTCEIFEQIKQFSDAFISTILLDFQAHYKIFCNTSMK